jgi:hypothetical protein
MYSLRSFIVGTVDFFYVGPLVLFKILVKYVKLYVVFKLYLVIKQIIIKYIIIFLNKTNG